MIELDNVRLPYIHAFSTPRCMLNYQRSTQTTYLYYINVLRNTESQKPEVLTACSFLRTTHISPPLIKNNEARHKKLRLLNVDAMEMY